MSNLKSAVSAVTHLNDLMQRSYASTTEESFLTSEQASQIESHFGNYYSIGLCPCPEDPTKLCPCEVGTIIDFEPLLFTDDDGKPIAYSHRPNGEFTANRIHLYNSSQQILRGDVHIINVHKGNQEMTLTIPKEILEKA